ncbi:MAG: gamma-glutamyltransferase, partial [Bacteroidetes bacterium]
ALASFVCEPSLTSLGGGGFLNAYTASGEALLFDFFVQTPGQRHPVEEMDFVASQINFGTTVQPQYIGRGSAAVPGCPAGIWEAHQRLGRLPFTRIIEPALRLCREGVHITPYQAYTISILESVLLDDPESRAIFAPKGQLIRAGEWMYRPLLADTLDAYAREGARLFYEGEIGQRFAADNAARGGSVSLADLMAYQVHLRAPLRRAYRDYTLLTNPAPSAGGSMIAAGLSLLSGRPLQGHHPRGEAYVHLLAQVMQGMEAYRKGPLQTGPAEGDTFVQQWQARLDWLGNTTQISVLDAEGNAASLTTTLGGASGRNIPGTGVPTNNMLGELDLHPEGYYRWTPNQRVQSMMSPSVVLHEGQPVFALGSGGSSRIRTAVLQVLVNLIDHGMHPEDAVLHPRLHWEHGVLNLEPGLIEHPHLLRWDDAKVILWHEPNMFFGGVHLVGRDRKGRLLGVGDARRDGAWGGA